MSHCPITHSIDLLVIGASSAAASAALSARNAGASVCLVSPLNYLGEDITAYLRFELEEGERPGTDLARAVFGGPKRPIAVKRTLEQTMVDAGVALLFSSQPIGALENDGGGICGVIVGNRAGRQGLLAKRIIDATEFGLVARAAGLPFSAWDGGNVRAEFRVVADTALHDGAEQMADLFPLPGKDGDTNTPMFRYVTTETLPDNSIPSWAGVQKRVQAACWQHNSVVYSEKALILPRDHVSGEQHVDTWVDAETFAITALRTAEKSLSVLGPCADVTDDVAARLYRPSAGMVVGERLGAELARECAACAAPAPARVRRHGEPFSADGTVSYGDPALPVDAESTTDVGTEYLPRLGIWDALVVGGGTAGAPAAIAAARQGLHTMLVEAHRALGGVSTVGMIGSYYYGNICGFTSEIDDGVATIGPDNPIADHTDRWVPQWKQAWYHRQLLGDNVDLCFGSLACGVWREGTVVRGVVVATPYGCGLVEARSIIDATGAADIAAFAGAPCRHITHEHVAVQGTGLSPCIVGKHYTNTDHTFIDDTSPTDVTTAMVAAKKKYPDAFDMSPFVDSRERRQIRGEYELSPIDFFRDHTFSDSICFASSNFDSHGFTVHPVFILKAPDKTRMWVHVPYRALLPRKLDNVLVTGLGISAQRDVLPVVRMIPDVQNQGYAAGYAAATAQQQNTTLRDVSIREVQQHLVDIGNLKAEVLEQSDSPLPKAGEIAEAVRDGVETYRGLAIIFACPEQSLPLVREAHAQCDDTALKLTYAKIAAFLGDPCGAADLYAHVERNGWDDGWNYTGMGQYGMSCSTYDSVWMAIGACGAEGDLGVLADRVRELNAACDFSHARAVAAACRGVGRFDTADSLARAVYDLLTTEGIAGHSMPDVNARLAAQTDAWNETAVRNRSLRELVLARGLWYCGDHECLGEATLRQYAGDVRGLFARHARAVLEERATPGRATARPREAVNACRVRSR